MTAPAVQPLPRETAPGQYQQTNEQRYRQQVDEELAQKHDRRSNLRLGRGKSLILSSPGGVEYSLSLSDAGILTVTDAATGDTADIILDWASLNGVPDNLAALDGTEGINNALVPAYGANVIRSTHFPDILRWIVNSNTTGLTPGFSRFTDSNNEAYIQFTGFGTATGVHQLALQNSESLNQIAVIAGARYEFSADIYISPTGVSGEVLVLWRNAAGSTVGATVTVGSVSVAGSWARVSAFATAPADAASALFLPRAFTFNGAVNPFIAFRRPFAARARAEQTAFTPYAPGAESDLNSDVTADNTAAAITGQGVWATGNYYEQTSDPGSVPNGSFWFETDTNELYVRRSGAWGKIADITAPAPTTPSARVSSNPVYTGADGNRTTSAAALTETALTGTITYLWSVTQADASDIVVGTPTSSTATFRWPSMVGDREVSIQCIVTANEGIFVAPAIARWTSTS